MRQCTVSNDIDRNTNNSIRMSEERVVVFYLQYLRRADAGKCFIRQSLTLSGGFALRLRVGVTEL